MDVVKVKKRDNKLGIVMIPSKRYVDLVQEFWSLNNVLLEDGTTILVGDEDIEVIDDDRSKKFNKQIERLYNK